MSDVQWQLFAVILGITMTTIVTRGAFVLLPQRWQLPSHVQAPLRYAPIAAISAIIAPELFANPMVASGFVVSSILLNAKLWGAVAGAAVYLRFTNMGGAIAAGMGAFWFVRWLLS